MAYSDYLPKEHHRSLKIFIPSIINLVESNSNSAYVLLETAALWMLEKLIKLSISIVSR